MICQVWRVARSSVYATAAPLGAAPMQSKRGPKTPVTDPDLVAAIRRVLSETPFHGEGYRKVRARLAHRGVAVGGKRVLRLMRQHQLLAPRRLGPPNGDPAHAGTITTTRPNEMWGTDATRFYTEHDGWCWFFGAIDRLARGETRRSLGGARIAAPSRTAGAGRGQRPCRSPPGPGARLGEWINEVKWLGITISPSYVGEPECNGVAERFMRTLKEQCIYLHRFETLAEAQRIIGEFIARYNAEWLIERLGHQTPSGARAAARAA
jgi:transposase InsO family protein